MGQLCIYLTPFASDYSGVCSSLFNLDFTTVINDAACCTSHYVFYDEPRWEEKVRPIFSTGMRNIDAILGNDEKLIETISEAAENIDTEMVAVIGTPVPAITGMDTEGIASEIEFHTGKPSFGFNTTGFNYYDKGIAMAGKALIDRFAEDMPRKDNSVNIIGVTPLDFANVGNETFIEKILEKADIGINSRFFMNTDITQVRNCTAAKLNLAVSASGLELCKLMKKRFGIPYITGFPMGKRHGQMWINNVRAALNGDIIEPLINKNRSGRNCLIIHDQIIGNSLREALKLAGCSMNIDVGSFFGWDNGLAEECDIHFSEEADYIMLLKNKKYDVIIGDEMMFRCPQSEGSKHIQLVHPASSGRLGWNSAVAFCDFVNLNEIKGICF